jgi:D-3-phosphoglycerate dehydrogenase
MENRHKVLMLGQLPEPAVDLFRARDDVTAELVTDVSEANLLKIMGDAAGITVRSAKITRPVIECAPALKVVSRFGVGYDGVDVEALDERGIPLTVAGSANSVNVAELTLYLMLELTKRGIQHNRAVRGDDWAFRLNFEMTELWQKTLLIIGFGRVGTRVAARARAFEMNILACDPYIDQQIIRDAGCTPVEDYRAALPEADYVTLHLPLTDESRHMIGADELQRMRSSAALINSARGGIVDEAALYAALSRGGIRAAGLDVLAQEPPTADNPLFALDNVVFTPHMGGASKEASLRVGMVCAQNVLDAIDGKLDPDLVVNPEVLSQDA